MTQSKPRTSRAKTPKGWTPPRTARQFVLRVNMEFEGVLTRGEVKELVTEHLRSMFAVKSARVTNADIP